MPLQPLAYQNKRPVAVSAFSTRIIVPSDIDSLLWITRMTSEESLAEMPQYINVSRGMCAIIIFD